MDLVSAIVELYRKAATELPMDVVASLQSCLKREKKGSLGRHTLETIIENVKIARSKKRPMCQDTGTPIFFVTYGSSHRQIELKEAILEATKRATSEVPLRPNTTDILSGKNPGTNLGEGIPVMYFEERSAPGLELGLILKGGGCENVGMIYTLPDMKLGAERSLDGIRRCVLDSAYRAQAQGCPPMIASVVAGSPEDLVLVQSKRQLLRPIGSINPIPELSALEKRLTDEINSLGIGPGGFGGRSTVMTTFVTTLARHPASFFVHISYFCWASRRAILKWHDGDADFVL